MEEKCGHNLFGGFRIQFNGQFELIWAYSWKDGLSAACFHLWHVWGTQRADLTEM